MGHWRKTPSEGGSGGGRGHSAMEHWQPTAEVKANASARRRRDDREFPEIAIAADWEAILVDDTF